MNNTSTIDNGNSELVFGLLGIAIGIVGLIQNGIALAAIYVAVEDLQPVHRFLISLSLSDIGIITFFVIEQVDKITLNANIETSIGICIARNLLESMVFATYLSLFGALLCLALDLYLALCKPLHHLMYLTKRRTNFIIIFSWITSILLGYSNTWASLYKARLDTRMFCEETVQQYAKGIQKNISLICGGTLAAVMLFLYCRVAWEICKLGSLVMPVPETLNPIQAKKAFLTIILVTGTMVIFMAPSFMFAALFNILHVGPGGQFCLTWSLLNCVADPLIYSLRMPEIRVGYRKLCLKLCNCLL